MPDIFDRLATSPAPATGGGDIFDRMAKSREKETDPEKLFNPEQRKNLA